MIRVDQRIKIIALKLMFIDSTSFLLNSGWWACHRKLERGRPIAAVNVYCLGLENFKLCKSLAPGSRSSHARSCLGTHSSPWTEDCYLWRNFAPWIWAPVFAMAFHCCLHTYPIYFRLALSRCLVLRAPSLRQSTSKPSRTCSFALCHKRWVHQ